MLDSLPMIETVETSIRRPQEEVVRRTIALAIVAVKGEMADANAGDHLIRQFGAEGFFTPDEQAFMEDRAPDTAALTRFGWRYEGAHVIL